MGHSNQKVGRSGAAARCTLCCIITKHIRPLPYTLNFTYIFSDQMEFHIFPQSHNCSSTTMSHYHGTYIHTHTQGLFEFLRNSFYLFLLRVKLLQCKILLPLNKKKNARIVWFMLEKNSIKMLDHLPYSIFFYETRITITYKNFSNSPTNNTSNQLPLTIWSTSDDQRTMPKL